MLYVQFLNCGNVCWIVGKYDKLIEKTPHAHGIEINGITLNQERLAISGEIFFI